VDEQSLDPWMRGSIALETYRRIYVLHMVCPMSEKRLGPRGGETTVSKLGMIRKTLWLHADEVESLRDKAYRERRTESDIIREGLRRVLGLED
jgi:hypothetical protein